MAEQQGGMRRPQNPAPVSGRGRLSQRTDGGPQQVQAEMSGMPYGENQEFEAIQASAPMRAAPSASSPRARQRKATKAGRQATAPLFSATQRPEEPVTSGAPFGPGSNAQPAQRTPSSLSSILQRMAMNDTSGDSEALLALAQRLGY